MCQGHFFKIFFLSLLVYSCTNQHSGPYAYIQVMPKQPSPTFLSSDTVAADPGKEISRLQAEIFSPQLLQKTLKPFHEANINAENIKDYLVTEVQENTHMVQIRFYNENEAFSCAFLDSLVKHYQQYRNTLLKKQYDQEMGNMNQAINQLKDTLNLYADSMALLPKKQGSSLNFFDPEQGVLFDPRSPEGQKIIRWQTALDHLQKRYTLLFEQKTEKAILAAGNFYSLYVLQHARYQPSKGKDF